MSRFNAWQLVPRDGSLAGFSLSATGGMATVSDQASVRQAILLLLATRRGERVMHPEYGCDLHDLVFAPNDDTTAGLAIYYVRQALERWEPRVTILQLDARQDPEQPTQLQIILDYQLRTPSSPERLVFTLDLTGG